MTTQHSTRGKNARASYIDRFRHWVSTPLAAGASTVLEISPPPKNRLHRIARLLSSRRQSHQGAFDRSTSIGSLVAKKGAPALDLLLTRSDHDALQSDWEAVYADLHGAWLRIQAELVSEETERLAKEFEEQLAREAEAINE
jgi:hypothetical protein